MSPFINTKRAERLAELSSDLPWGINIWMGVIVKRAQYKNRLSFPQETDAVVKFISFESLIGATGKVDLKGIDWVIVGGESGLRTKMYVAGMGCGYSRSMLGARFPFFFKQWGAINKKKNGWLLNGR